MTSLLALVVAAVAAVTPARVQVVADEFRYSLSRQTLKSGPVLIELANFGEDEHDLRLRRVGGTRTYAIGKVLPGERKTLETRLRPGTFRLWCSLGDHRTRGMTATLRVR